jgi:hypothetical protein
MAEHDELAQLREDLTQQQAASITLLDIVKSIDRNVTEIVGAVRSIQAHEAIVDARLSAIDARAQAAAAEMKLFKSDMERSFEQVSGEFALVDRKLDAMATKQDLAAMEDRILGAFQNLMDIVSERTKKGE